jgi:hypothetical protein
VAESQSASPTTPIAPREAIAKAFAALSEFFAGQELKDVALEEVQVSDDNRFWQITLGFSIPVTEQVKDSCRAEPRQNPGLN